MKANTPSNHEYEKLYGILKPASESSSAGCQYSCHPSCRPGQCKSCTKCKNPNPLKNLWDEDTD